MLSVVLPNPLVHVPQAVVVQFQLRPDTVSPRQLKKASRLLAILPAHVRSFVVCGIAVIS
jgi:hypothetical protein